MTDSEQWFAVMQALTPHSSLKSDMLLDAVHTLHTLNHLLGFGSTAGIPLYDIGGYIVLHRAFRVWHSSNLAALGFLPTSKTSKFLTAWMVWGGM